jgi:hypothetical protein
MSIGDSIAYWHDYNLISGSPTMASIEARTD